MIEFYFDMDTPILEIKNLYVSYGEHDVIKDISFSFQKGKSYALLGSSGEGKSTLLKAIDGLIPSSGDILFKGGKIIAFDDFRKNSCCFLLQDPKNQFNPVYSIGSQLNRTQKIIKKENKEEIKKRTLNALRKAGLDESVYNLYPHQMSGGMLQRANLAIALLSRKELILLDEPTLGLDRELEELLIDRILDLVKNDNSTLIYITHSLELASKADYIAILRNGRIIEQNSAKELLIKPKEEYTKELIRASCYV